MKRFPGLVDQKQVMIEGEDFKDAMERAGYIPITKTKYGNRFVGKLVDGRRFSIRYQGRIDVLKNKSL